MWSHLANANRLKLKGLRQIICYLLTIACLTVCWNILDTIPNGILNFRNDVRVIELHLNSTNEVSCLCCQKSRDILLNLILSFLKVQKNISYQSKQFLYFLVYLSIGNILWCALRQLWILRWCHNLRWHCADFPIYFSVENGVTS